MKNIRTCLKSSTENSSNEKDENNERKDLWTSEELERLLQFVAKVFMLQFPLYAGPKSAGLRNEEVSAAEATQMAVYCDVHDSTGIYFFYKNYVGDRQSRKPLGRCKGSNSFITVNYCRIFQNYGFCMMWTNLLKIFLPL